ncbi:MAG: hypothetical protein GX175_07620 [Halanaerobiaceae bacterium]|nr:hypothetical protein [Halanaerobiaceae bacterium]
MMLNLLAEVIWHGNLVQTRTLVDGGVPNPITLPRKPINITLTIVSGAEGSKSRTIEDPKYSTINNAMNEILKEYQGGTPAKFSIETIAISSLEHLDYCLNGECGLIFKIGAEFKEKNEDKKSYVLVKIILLLL